MLRAVKRKVKSVNQNIKILGVTVLTSLNNRSLKEIGYTDNVDKIVLKQANLIVKSGCDGVVCSAKEAKLLRKKYKNLFIVTPGIRFLGDNLDDQARVVTPYEALKKNRVNAIVMGRSLVNGNIKNNIKKLADHLNQ